MATVLDVSLLQAFEPIFAVLFVFAFLFAILQKTKAVSGSVGLNGLMAVIAAFLVLLSEELVIIINFMIPWFTVLFIFVILLLLVFQLFGAKEADFASALKERSLRWAIMGICGAILLAAVGTVIPEDIGPNLGGADVDSGVEISEGSSSSGLTNNIMDIIFNTKVIGVIIIFLVAIFAVIFLSIDFKV